MSTIQIATNAVTAKLMNADRATKLHISELLSYVVEGAEFSNSFASGGWDGRSSFFSMRNGTFPAGFLALVHRKLRNMGYDVQIIRHKLPAPRGPERPVVDEFGEDPRYQFQYDTVDRLVRYGMMVAQVATGGGKSRIAKIAVARIKRPTIFLTTRSVLMYQMKAHFEAAGIRVGVMGDGEWTPCRGVNVGMVQTIQSRLEDKTIDGEIERYLVNLKTREDKAIEDLQIQLKKAKTPVKERVRQVSELRKRLAARRLSDKQIAEKVKKTVERQSVVRAQMIRILNYFEFAILEEAHEASGNGYYDILRHCKSAYYRLALTATPFMRPDAESNMRLMACSGPVGIRITEKELIGKGILATPYFKYLNIAPPKGLYRTTGWQRAYKLGVIEHQARNKAIIFEALRATKMGLSVMILVQRKNHGKMLREMLKKTGLSVRFIFGEHDQETRQAALTGLGNGEIDVLIGSTILDVGVDVPAVGMVILAGGGKAEIALRQRIGRGLRAKKSGPNVAFVVDFNDSLNTYLREHAATRRKIIEGTPGFVENIIPIGADFDFAGLGFTSRLAS